MKGLTSLENRIEVLERPTKFSIDPLVLVLERLNDAERGLVTEYRSLLV
jgi:hypothetical protein